MTAVAIENPIINAPFEAPRRHFQFDDNGITDKIAETRRRSGYFIPIASPKKKGKQQQLFDDLPSGHKPVEHDDINLIRDRVALWRDQGHPGITLVNLTLLDHWKSPDRARRLFFFQIEAVETFRES